MYRNIEIVISGVNFPADLISLNMEDFDLLLGINWLSFHRASVNCFTKEVTFQKPKMSELVFKGDRRILPNGVISAIEANKCLQKGCSAYLAFVRDTNVNEPILEDIPIVKDFPDVFPEESPRIPPDREIELKIDIMSDSSHS